MSCAQVAGSLRTTQFEELAGRCELAERDEQEQLLTEVFEAIKGSVQTRRGSLVSFHPDWFAFQKMLRALAYESAALTLVPEGWAITLTEWPGQGAEAALLQTELRDDGKYWRSAGMREVGRCKAVTRALALCAAALRARSAA